MKFTNQPETNRAFTFVYNKPTVIWVNVCMCVCQITGKLLSSTVRVCLSGVRITVQGSGGVWGGLGAQGLLALTVFRSGHTGGGYTHRRVFQVIITEVISTKISLN